MEPVFLQSEKAISHENMVVEMAGENGKCSFNWRVIEDPKNPLLPNRVVRRFQIKLFDFKQSLTGQEALKIYFKNYSEIMDLANNSLNNEQYSSESPAPFIYLSPVET